MKTLVTVMLKRLPTGEDYKRVGLTSGMYQGYIQEGNQIVNALMSQFNDNLRVEFDDNPNMCNGDPVIHFECDTEGFEGAWYLPADLFEMRAYYTESETHGFSPEMLKAHGISKVLKD
jgi:hypothetical protein